MPLLLILLGIILIVYNYNAIKTKNTSFEFTLNKEKENLNDYKMEIGILRRDIGESLTELQEEIKNIKISLNMANDVEKIYENNDISSNIDNAIEDDVEFASYDIDSSEELHNVVISNIDFEDNVLTDESSKTNSIMELIKQELDDDEICQKLSISKGEVLLVRNLFKN